jgi:hypothetical protein
MFLASLKRREPNSVEDGGERTLEHVRSYSMAAKWGRRPKK